MAIRTTDPDTNPTFGTALFRHRALALLQTEHLQRQALQHADHLASRTRSAAPANMHPWPPAQHHITRARHDELAAHIRAQRAALYALGKEPRGPEVRLATQHLANAGRFGGSRPEGSAARLHARRRTLDWLADHRAADGLRVDEIPNTTYGLRLAALRASATPYGGGCAACLPDTACGRRRLATRYRCP